MIFALWIFAVGWLLPIIYACVRDVRARRRYHQRIDWRIVARDAFKRLAWPLGIIDLVRGKR